VYSIRKRAERRNKSDEKLKNLIEAEIEMQPSESPSAQMNASYLNCCVDTLRHLFPIINEEISQAASDIIFDTAKYDEAKYFSAGFRTCLAIGAFLEGNVPEAKRLFTEASSMIFLSTNSTSKMSFVRSQLLICLFLKMTGDLSGATHFLQVAERESGSFLELQAIVAAFKLSFFPSDSCEENAFNFQIDRMQNFTIDSKIFFYYRSLLQKHTFSGFFKEFSQAQAHECYQSFLLAEKHTHTSDLILKSPYNWVRLQPFLVLLELFHLGKAMEALKRARRLTLFLLQNQEYLQKIHKLVDAIPLLSIVGTIFQEIQDVTFLEMVIQIHASLSQELVTLEQKAQQNGYFHQLLKHLTGKVEEDALDMEKMMTEPIEDELGV